MTLAAGTKLGPYEIQSPLGAGGMGEVYRATDSKLGRDVALKIILQEFAQDTQLMARFQREAQVLASLNHRGFQIPSSQARHQCTQRQGAQAND